MLESLRIVSCKFSCLYAFLQVKIDFFAQALKRLIKIENFSLTLKVPIWSIPEHQSTVSSSVAHKSRARKNGCIRFRQSFVRILNMRSFGGSLLFTKRCIKSRVISFQSWKSSYSQEVKSLKNCLSLKG